MSHCHNHYDYSWITETVSSVIPMDNLVAFIALFATGIVGSFTHCIGMCGPIAINQVNMRLLAYSDRQIDEWARLKIATALPYYIGKALTYALLGLGFSGLSQSVIKLPYMRYGGAILILSAALFFLYTAAGNNLNILKQFGLKQFGFIRKINNMVANVIGRGVETYAFGASGIILGMILGLLPCGLVYASLVLADSLASNAFYAALAMFAFGLGTIPGLFIVSYLGQSILSRWQPIFKIFYSLVMLFNAFLLGSFAYNLLQ